MLRFIYNNFSKYWTPVLLAFCKSSKQCMRLSHDVIGNCAVAWMGRKPGTEVVVNSCKCNAIELVSIVLSWPLLPPKVSVNRQVKGHSCNTTADNFIINSAWQYKYSRIATTLYSSSLSPSSYLTITSTLAPPGLHAYLSTDCHSTRENEWLRWEYWGCCLRFFHAGIASSLLLPRHQSAKFADSLGTRMQV